MMTSTRIDKKPAAQQRGASKTKFILAAIAEIEAHGVTDLSVRRVAERCGMSPGAPYRHFNGKNGLILEVLKYVSAKWERAQRLVLERVQGGARERLIEVSIAYIRFLCDDPEFQTILMMNDRSMLPEQRAEKARLTALSEQLIHDYCTSVHMRPEDEQRKTYAVRSFIFGAAFMINSGAMPYTEQTLAVARSCIAREFDLP